MRPAAAKTKNGYGPKHDQYDKGPAKRNLQDTNTHTLINIFNVQEMEQLYNVKLELYIVVYISIVNELIRRKPTGKHEFWH